MLPAPIAMHRPDEFLSFQVSILFWLITILVIGYALKRVSADLGERQVPIMGVLAASTAFPYLFVAMRALRIPRLLVSIFGLMLQYMFILVDEGRVVADGSTHILMNDIALLEAHGLERP